MKTIAIIVSAVIAAAAPLHAQTVSPQHGGTRKGAAAAPKKAGDGAGQMQGMLGGYPMNRDASGTSWQPDSSPAEGAHMMSGKWALMMNGYANFVYDRQDCPRGEDKTFSTNMFMAAGQRPLKKGALALRGMVSLEPLTVGSGGYPLLFQTGETSDGRTPLIDRQHPHDLFMELAALYRYPLTAKSSLYFYGALPGEPALGPPVYMQRFSGSRIPDAPLTHHWLDSTHITYGVATLGYVVNNIKLEGSVFRGREPDENRWDIEQPKFDSYSFRVSVNPGANWALQASRGFLKSPEQLRPDNNTYRTTVSAIYNRLLEGDNWQTTLTWGQNDTEGQTLNGLLLESTLLVAGRLALFGRFESVDKSDLLLNLAVPVQAVYKVNKLELGFSYDVARWGRTRWGLGASFAVHAIPESLKPYYGESPVSALLFASVRL